MNTQTLLSRAEEWLASQRADAPLSADACLIREMKAALEERECEVVRLKERERSLVDNWRGVRKPVCKPGKHVWIERGTQAKHCDVCYKLYKPKPPTGE